ncbi:MAG: AAA family ATPase, partial [Fusobacteriaceae bacterium]
MKKIKLVSLEILNFKGIKELKINFGDKTNIFGDNGTGKTTVLDSILWCLFEKNSDDKTKFSIKPLDENGREINYIETSVKAVLEVDGVEVEFLKKRSEKWVKKRGNEEQIFDGHIIENYLNEVPTKSGEYNEFIKSIIDDKIFKLLTSPNFFSSLKWEEQRKLIVQMSGDISNDDIVAANPDLKIIVDELEKLINGAGTVELKSKYQNQSLKIKKDIEEIPNRIDEASKSIIDTRKKEEIENELKKITDEIEKLNLEISRSGSSTLIQEKKNEIAKLEGEKIEAQNKLNQENNEAKKGLVEEIEKLAKNIKSEKEKISELEKFNLKT